MLKVKQKYRAKKEFYNNTYDSIDSGNVYSCIQIAPSINPKYSMEFLCQPESIRYISKPCPHSIIQTDTLYI